MICWMIIILEKYARKVLLRFCLIKILCQKKILALLLSSIFTVFAFLPHEKFGENN